MNLFLALISLNIKTALATRAAFFVRLGFAIFNHGFLLVMWVLLFKAVPVIHGWTIWHLMMTYGLAWFAWGFVAFFAYGLRILPRTIEFGELDHFLLQPRPLLLMIASNSGEVSGLPDMLLAGAMIVTAAVKIHALWYLVVLALASAALVFTAFTLAIGSLAFWLNDMHDWLHDTLYNLYIFATRPSSAFGGWVKILMFSLLPMGFISYLPVEIIRLQDPILIAAQLLGSITVIGISLLIFRFGLKHYESGNRFGIRV